MSKNTISINGEKLRSLLEGKSKKSIYDLAESEGFSRNFLQRACSSGKASPIVQSVAKRYGIFPKDYMIQEEDLKQMSIEDLQSEKTTRAIDESQKTFLRLGAAVNKYGDALREAFEKLTKDWNKAVEEYNESINKIREEIK